MSSKDTNDVDAIAASTHHACVAHSSQSDETSRDCTDDALRGIAAQLYVHAEEHLHTPTHDGSMVELEVRLCRLVLSSSSPASATPNLEDVSAESRDGATSRPVAQNGDDEPLLYLPFHGHKHGIDVGVSAADFARIEAHVTRLRATSTVTPAHASHGSEACAGDAVKPKAATTTTPAMSYVKVMDIRDKKGVRFSYKVDRSGAAPPTFLEAGVKTRLRVDDVHIRHGPYDLRVALSRESPLAGGDAAAATAMQRTAQTHTSKPMCLPPGYKRVKDRLRVRADDLFVYDLTKVSNGSKGTLYEVEIEFCPAPGAAVAQGAGITEGVIYEILRRALQLTRIGGLTGLTTTGNGLVEPQRKRPR